MEIDYMLMDGVFFKFRVKKVVDGSVRQEIKRIPILVVIGVTAAKQRFFLTIQRGNKDSAATWRQIFRDLNGRSLNASEVKLGIMDGLQGLEKVIREEFQNAKIQRCIVITKAPKTMRQVVTDSLRDIFYAIDRKTVTERYDDFVKTLIPNAVASLKRSIQ